MLQKRKLYDVTAPNRSTKIINGESSNVLNWDDIAYPWAYPMYKNMLANFWIPSEVNMTNDIKQWSQLTDQERETFQKIIGLLAFLDSIQTDFTAKVSDYLTDSSLSALMSVLSFQEVVHNQSYSYVLSTLVNKTEQDAVFEYWKHDPILLKRNDFVAKGYQAFLDNPSPQTFFQAIVYDVILEGLFFYSGFSFFYNLARNQKMVASSTMISYINRDEEIHVRLFTQIMKELIAEHPELHSHANRIWVKETIEQAARLEIEWGRAIISNHFSGITMNELEEYIQFMANKRAHDLGFEKPFDQQPKNTMRWITVFENPNTNKTDFFEQKSRTYVKVSDSNGFDDL